MIPCGRYGLKTGSGGTILNSGGWSFEYHLYHLHPPLSPSLPLVTFVAFMNSLMRWWVMLSTAAPVRLGLLLPLELDRLACQIRPQPPSFVRMVLPQLEY